MTDEHDTKGIRVSEQRIDLMVRVECDDGANWFRGVVVAYTTKPLSAWHGDAPGVEETERIIWTGEWHKSDPNIPDFNHGERRAIDEALAMLAGRMAHLIGGRG